MNYIYVKKDGEDKITDFRAIPTEGFKKCTARIRYIQRDIDGKINKFKRHLDGLDNPNDWTEILNTEQELQDYIDNRTE